MSVITKTVHQLPDQFRKSTFDFQQVKESEYGYIYAVSDKDLTFYEVFEKKETPLCLDFKNRLYSDTEFKHRYPSNEDFGKWAWTHSSLVRAEIKLTLIDKRLSNLENKTK